MGSSARAIASLALAFALLPGCLASTVLDSSERAVRQERPELDWRPALPADLPGLHESTRLEGEAAGALWKLLYHFAADGSYTGAALVFDGERAAFQTLSGTWSLEDGELALDGAAAGTASVAGEVLRLSSATGAAWFRRVPEHGGP